MKLSELTKEKEFDIIFEKFLFPLVGVPYGGFKKIQLTHDENNHVKFNKDKNELLVFEELRGDSCLTIKVSKNFPNELVDLLNIAFVNINDIRHFNPKKITKSTSYLQLLKNLDFCIEKSVISWLCSDTVKAENIQFLLNSLEEWKSKTYEGKNVNFAFVVDITNKPKNEKDNNFYYLDFLNEEYSATITDGITSCILLDSNLNFVKYLSTSSGTVIHDFKTGPLRFSDFITNFVKDNIGVLLLGNGDLIIAKNNGIKLVKREGKWLNFSKEVFSSYISAILDKDNDLEFENLVEEIYLSCLDVSFSHSGGIVAYILDKEVSNIVEPNIYADLVQGVEIAKDAKQPIVHFIDNLSIGIKPYTELIELNPSYFDKKESKKRFLKREFLQKVIGNSSFKDLDRKLRCEIISMDGATIIKENGKFLSVGAIIQNDSGSYGGGRGAAARKLSNFGFAIKISTDGYIECYKKGDIIFKIK